MNKFIALLLAPAFLLLSCGPDTEIVFVDRSGCLACHRPIDEAGDAHGIEHAHPPINGTELTCEQCHGGDPKSRKRTEAHVSPPSPEAAFIRNLTIEELDNLPEDYIRFVNPGDLRVAGDSCGSGAGADCHQVVVDRVIRNQMATFSGELGVARYRAGMQASGAGVKGVYDVRDEGFVFDEIPGTVGLLQKMAEPRVEAAESTIGPFQDLYLTKACMRCHLWSFGDNRFAGDYRSSGCTACHMNYDDDGLSQSADPTVDRQTAPHPIEHVLTNKIPSQQCMHCHYRGGRIGPSYHGYREGAGAGFGPEKPGFLGEPLHGHDADFYITDENTDNGFDETPPDVHAEAGMHCIDCHGEHDVHGDGHIYTSTEVAISIRCESCHGTAQAESTLTTRLGASMDNLHRDDDGVVWLTKKIDGEQLAVTQIKKSLEATVPGSRLHQSMGVENGFSHLDSVACHTCHSDWMPNCYGCHVEVDMRDQQRSLISGLSTPGRITGGRKWVSTDDLILMLDSQGRVAPSMPAERMFFSAYDGGGNKVIDNQIRRLLNGDPGMGQRTFNPHTVRRAASFGECSRCHPNEAGSNAELIDQAHGFGTDRYIETDGDGVMYRLDQVQDRTYQPVVSIGHDEPEKSQPLPAPVVDRMRGVTVP